jgi:hypothetical protein
MALHTNKPSFENPKEVLKMEMVEMLKEPVLLHHNRCGTTWLYKGKNPFCTSCSFCKGTVSIRKNKVVVLQEPQLKQEMGIDNHQMIAGRASQQEQLSNDGITNRPRYTDAVNGDLDDKQHRT